MSQESLDPELSNLQMFNASEAARLLGISPQTMYSIINEGEIEFSKIRNRIMISKVQLLDYVKKARDRRTKSNPNNPESCYNVIREQV